MRVCTSYTAFLVLAKVLMSSYIIKSESVMCSPCADGAELKLIRTPPKCQEYSKTIEGQGSIDNTACLTQQLMHYQDGCCDNAPKGLDGCDSISCDASAATRSDSVFNPSIFVPNLDYTNSSLVTCQDVATDDSFLATYLFTPGQCADTFRARSAAWCGCGGERCDLCPGGLLPTKSNRVEKLIFKWDCATFQYFTALLNPDTECPVMNEILRFDAARFCGCTGLEEKQPICKMCQNGQVLKNLDQKQTALEADPTCSDVDASVSFIATEEYCQETVSTITQLGVVSACCRPPGEVDSNSSTDDIDSAKNSGSETGNKQCKVVCWMIILFVTVVW